MSTNGMSECFSHTVPLSDEALVIVSALWTACSDMFHTAAVVCNYLLMCHSIRRDGDPCAVLVGFPGEKPGTACLFVFLKCEWIMVMYTTNVHRCVI